MLVQLMILLVQKMVLIDIHVMKESEIGVVKWPWKKTSSVGDKSIAKDD